jgi:hypothetical protein
LQMDFISRDAINVGHLPVSRARYDIWQPIYRIRVPRIPPGHATGDAGGRPAAVSAATTVRPGLWGVHSS